KAGGATSSVSAATAMARRSIRRATLAAPFGLAGACSGQCTRYAGGPGVVRKGLHSGTSGRAEPGAERWVGVQPAPRGAEPVRVARFDDQSCLLVADKRTCRRPDGVTGDHGYSLVERFVDDEAPRLKEVARGDRR